MEDKTIKALSSLDLAPGASLEDVKRSYRELALIWHPDKVPDQVKDRATNKFMIINEAYQWLTRHPNRLKEFPSHQSVPRAGTKSTSRSTQTGPTRANTGRQNAVQRILKATLKIREDAGTSLYIYPNIDFNRATNFIMSLRKNQLFDGIANTVKDLLVFYDIDGTGEEGMAITRSNQLVNNNTLTVYDLRNLEEVKLKEGFFFWSEIFVRSLRQNRLERIGYAEKVPGRALAQILQELVTKETFT